MAQQHRAYLVKVLEETHGNVTHAARIADVERISFYKMMQRFNIKPLRTFGGNRAWKDLGS